jgi:predicted MPP superfamily phosphohydrolase
MSFEKVVAGTLGAGLGLLAYGMLFETRKLVVEEQTLRLPRWPHEMEGYRIGLLADLHLRPGKLTLSQCKRAVEAVLLGDPDAVILVGDYVGMWQDGVDDLLAEGLSELRRFRGPKIAIPGNRDYLGDTPDRLLPIFDPLGIQLLRNEAVTADEISWVGIDSANAGQDKPAEALSASDPTKPLVILWHEPDTVLRLPEGPELMLSGHSHGGQFIAPWGWAPMTSTLGKIYRKGFYLDAPVPIYVSRGLATTGPPSRLFCPPEVSLLTLRQAD